MTLFAELTYRGLVNDISSPDLIDKLNKGGMTFYIGTDPTGDSLHIGHYSSLLLAKRLEKAGHHPILLIGGGTGLIGDPKPNAERPMIEKEEVMRNFVALKKQAERLFGFEVVNNNDWYQDIKMVDFLRDYGKYFNLGYMLAKDIVKRRIEEGITYAEFSYMILQALDFYHLHMTRGVDLQVAGQDQWGNMTAGIELIRKKTGDAVYAFTMPLILKSDGTKFGKSEGGSIWLDKNKTSPYELYQFLLNTEDEKAVEYLKKFTFLSKAEIDALEEDMKTSPHLRLAQHALAKEVVTDLHGESEYQKAKAISEALFKGNIANLTLDDINVCFKGIKAVSVSQEIGLTDALLTAGAVKSKREARDLIASGAISVNGKIVKDIGFVVTKTEAFGETATVIRRGKKNYYLLKHE